MNRKGRAVPDDVDPKSVRTRERILDAAAHVLSRKGFAGTRLSDVAEYADLQAPAIYYYFKSREALIEEVMYVGATLLTDNLESTLSSLPESLSPLDRVLAAVDSHLRYILTISDYTMAAVRNGGQLPEHLRQRSEAGRRAYGRLWGGLFQDAQDAGQIDASVDPGMARMLIIGAMNWAVEWWRPERGSIETLIATTQRMLVSGFALDVPATKVSARPAIRKTRRRSSVAS